MTTILLWITISFGAATVASGVFCFFANRPTDLQKIAALDKEVKALDEAAEQVEAEPFKALEAKEREREDDARMAEADRHHARQRPTGRNGVNPPKGGSVLPKKSTPRDYMEGDSSTCEEPPPKKPLRSAILELRENVWSKINDLPKGSQKWPASGTNSKTAADLVMRELHKKQYQATVIELDHRGYSYQLNFSLPKPENVDHDAATEALSKSVWEEIESWEGREYPERPGGYGVSGWGQERTWSWQAAETVFEELTEAGIAVDYYWHGKADKPMLQFAMHERDLSHNPHSSSDYWSKRKHYRKHRPQGPTQSRQW